MTEILPYWAYIPNFWGDHSSNFSYEKILEEIKGDLGQGSVSVYGNTFQESRLTCFYSLYDSSDNMIMSYSGRTLAPKLPLPGTIIQNLLNMFQSPEFFDTLKGSYPDLTDCFQDSNRPNAVFINWYRPTSMTSKPDGIGYHSDDETDHESDVIFSATFCPEGGERIFRFRDKNATKGFVWQKDLENGSMLIMRHGCQKMYKHSIGLLVKNLAGQRLDDKGRINITFRRIKLVKPLTR